MELMLYHVKEEPIEIGIRKFFVTCRKRYMELNNGADKSSDSRCGTNNSY